MDASKSKVLTVHDFYLTRNIVSYILRQNGFKAIDSVSNSRDALERLESGKYSIVISDWNPNIDGLSMLNAVKENPQLKNLIFIMVTSESDKNMIMKAMDQGVDGYVMKPFTAESLCNRIVHAIKIKYKDAYNNARQSVKQNKSQSITADAKPAMKVFGNSEKIPEGSARSWSSTLSYLRS